MKKNLIGLLSLASCVMLAGCGGGGGNTPTPVGPKEKKIEIADLPAKIYAGDEIDLSEYITVSGGVGHYYDINFSNEDFEKIAIDPFDDAKITLKYTTDVTVTISYEGITKDFVIHASSRVYDKYTEAADKAGYNYAFIEVGSDGYLGAYSNYGENFYLYTDSETKTYTGYVELADGVYTVSTPDFEEYTYEVSGYEPKTLAAYPNQFCLTSDVTKLVCEKGEKGQYSEYMVIDDVDVVRAASYYFFGVSGETLLDYYEFEPRRIEIEEVELTTETGEIQSAYAAYYYAYGELYVDSKEKEEGLIAISVLDFDKGSYFAADFVDYLSTDPVPQGQDISEDIIALSEAIESHEFVVDYTYGWEDAAGNSIANPFDDKGYMLHDYYHASGSAQAIVTETQTYAKAEGFDDVVGLVYHEGQVYEYYDEAGALAAYGLGVEDSVHSKDLADYGYNYMFLDVENGNHNYLADAFVNSRTEKTTTEGKTVVAEFSLSRCEGLFTSLFIDSFPVAATYDIKNDSYKDCDAASEVAQFLVDEERVYAFAASLTFNYDAAGALTSASFEFVWDDEDEAAKKEYYYVMAATFTFGSAEIPSTVVIGSYN